MMTATSARLQIRVVRNKGHYRCDGGCLGPMNVVLQRLVE
jgi:hypothetical protein